MRCILAGIFALGLLAGANAQPEDSTPTKDEQKAIDLVKKVGGKAVIDPKLPPEARVSAKFESISDRALADLKSAPKIGAISVFDATQCTEKGLASLKLLPQLRSLTLGQSKMTPVRVNAICQCKNLRKLYLGGAGLTDATLVGLKNLTFLESLDINDNPRVTDKGMAIVKQLERLQELYLGKTSITDKGLLELKGLDGLRKLNVVGTKVTGDTADKFADSMPNLRIVRR